MNEHDRYRELAAGASDGLLTDAEEHELLLHIRTCPACRAEMHAFDRDREALATIAPVPVSPRVRATVMAAGGRRGPTIRWTLLAAAVLVGTLGATVLLSGGGPRDARIALPDEPPVRSPTVMSSPRATTMAEASKPDGGPIRLRDAGSVSVGSPATSLVIADIDADGDRDLLAGRDGRPDQVVMFLGDGTGTFGGQSVLDLGDVASHEVADLDQDGIPDILGSSPSRDAVVIAYGLGRLGFEPPVALAVGTSPREVEADDIDGDGRPEIIVTDAGSDQLTILHADRPRAYDRTASLPTADGPTTLAAVDFDLDGNVDIAVGSRGSPGISIHWGGADGSFSGERSIPGIASPRDITVADLDADGDPDLVLSTVDRGVVTVLLTRPAGPFWVQASLPAPRPDTDRPGDMEIADLNGDGHPDILAVNQPNDELLVWPGLGDGRFGPVQAIAVGGTPRTIEVGDLDGDGRSDVAVSRDDATIQLLLTRS